MFDGPAKRPDSPLLLLDGADTLVFIDPAPPQSPSLNLPRFTAPIRHHIHSQKLLETDSPFFRKLFNPRTQTRIIRRRGLTGNLPDGIKHVIDLTPPSEEDDAVITLTELSCPMGIRTWARSRCRWILPSSCVGGQDEIEWVDAKSYKSLGADQTWGQPALLSQAPDELSSTSDASPISSTKIPGLPLEYSASRHRKGIEQILQVLEDFHPQLDTPCKLWTFFALAKLYDVATEPRICDLILSWFYESSNIRFVEINPEISYQVACGLRCTTLCWDSFAILVGEEALLLLTNSDHSGKQPSLRRSEQTWHGRFRESLDDTELQRIEYASKSFVDYVLNRFISLAGTEMAWLSNLPEVQKIHRHAPKTPIQSRLKSELLAALKAYARGIIVSSLLARGSQTWIPGPFTASMPFECYPPPRFAHAYGEMRYIERIMSRTSWRTLMTEQFTGDSYSILPKDLCGTSIVNLAPHLPLFMEEWDAKIILVPWSELALKASDFNAVYHTKEEIGTGNRGSIYSQTTENISGVGPFMYENLRREVKLDEPYFGGHNINVQPKGTDATNHGEVQFETSIFIAQARSYVSNYAQDMVESRRSAMFYELTDTLTCLTENEYKFLPLWAGGNDDGSGGVFLDQNIPILETGGFSAPGPAIHTGSTASSTDSFSMVTPSEYASTIQGASHNATASHETDLMSLDSVRSSRDGEIEAERNNETFTEWQIDDDDTSLDLSSSAEEVDFDFDYDSASDSDDTVVLGSISHTNIPGHIEGLHVEANNHAVLPLR